MRRWWGDVVALFRRLNRFFEDTTVGFAIVTLWHSIFYWIIVCLCILGGIVANPAFKIDDMSSFVASVSRAMSSKEATLGLEVVIGFFFLYFISRLILLDRPPKFDRPDFWDGVISASCHWLPAVYIVLFGAVLWALWRSHEIELFWLPLAVTFPSAAMFEMSLRQEAKRRSQSQRSQNAASQTQAAVGKAVPSPAHRFLPMIFYPAFSTCFLCFCLGWSIANGADSPTEFAFGLIRIREDHLIYCVFAGAIFVLYLLSRWKDGPIAAALAFLIFLPATFAASLMYYNIIGLSLVIALLWTFACGVAEVAKRGRLLEEDKVRPGNGETGIFYVMGANWSSILFYNLLLLLPIIVPATPMLLVVALAWGALVAWHLVKQKTSRQAYWRALAIGYAIPIGIIVLFLWGKYQSPFTFSLPDLRGHEHQTDRVITLLGVFLTITFVLYHNDYKEMAKDLRNERSQWFDSPRNCLLFAALVVAIEAVLLTIIFCGLTLSPLVAAKGLELDQMQTRLDIVLLLLTTELVTIFIWLFRTTPPAKERVKGPRKTRASAASAEAPAAAFISLTRPASSLIAGAFSFVCSFDSASFGLARAVTVFVCTSTLCMFGYTANDVCDFRKDLAAGRPDKLIATGRVSVLQGYMLMAALALVSLTVSSFLGTRMYLIMALSILFVLGYSEFSRKLPKLKGFYTGALCCLPVIIGSSASGTAINSTLLMTVIIFIFGRELVIDVADIVYDKRSHHSTLALSLGRYKSLLLGWLLMISSGLIIMSIQTKMGGQILAALAVLSLIAILFNFGFREVDKSMSFSRIPMLLTIGSLLFRA